ncbi:MAG: thiamine phosphate synthase [Sulfuricurvum sp.]
MHFEKLTHYEANITHLLALPPPKCYDRITKISIARFQNNDIFLTEFLYAKIQTLLENYHGHKEIDDAYIKLLPYVFIHYDEIIEDTRNGRVIISVFDSERRRILHVIDESHCLVSIFVMRKETFVRSKKYTIKSTREGGVSSILSPAMPFWRHGDLIEELYQKLRASMTPFFSYLITDPALYGTDVDTLNVSLPWVLSKVVPDFALFRDKTTAIYPLLAHRFIRICRQYGVQKIILHGDYSLAHRLGADGVHLMSTQCDAIAAAKALGLYVIISTHTHQEGQNAYHLGADAITYSPIFPSPNKGTPKGLEDLKEIVAKIELPIFALGGITTQAQITAVKECGAYGFASIRYFISIKE